MSTLSAICQKRLDADVKILELEPVFSVECYRNEANKLEWFFLVTGPVDSDYKGGEYIGKVIHSPGYPFNAPDYMMLTPNGRFTAGNKICLSNSGYHKDEWSAAWNIRTILQGFLSIMLEDRDDGISHIHNSKEERRKYAEASIKYNKETKETKDVYEKFMTLREEAKKKAIEKEAEKAKSKETKPVSKEVKETKESKEKPTAVTVVTPVVPVKPVVKPTDKPVTDEYQPDEGDLDIETSKALLEQWQNEHKKILEMSKKRKATAPVAKA